MERKCYGNLLSQEISQNLFYFFFMQQFVFDLSQNLIPATFLTLFEKTFFYLISS